jgi:hypothetical protein
VSEDVQRIIAELQRVLGLPATVGQITINLDVAGIVQSVESRQIFRRGTQKVVDNRGPCGA